MADTIQEQVLSAFYTVINTALPSAITDCIVERNRSRPVPEDKDNFLVLYDGPQTIISDDTCSTRYEVTIDVEGYVRSLTDETLGNALNELWGQLVLAAMADHTLGGLTVDVREGDLFDRYIDDEASKPTGVFTMTFLIEYSTDGGDPFTLG